MDGIISQKFTLFVYNCADDIISRNITLPLASEDGFASKYFKNGGYPTLKLEYRVNELSTLSINVSKLFQNTYTLCSPITYQITQV